MKFKYILNVKLLIKRLQRKHIAKYYNSNIPKKEDLILLSTPQSNSVSSLCNSNIKRDGLKIFNKKGIGTSIHYPIPPHLQEAYKALNFRKGSFPIAEKFADRLLSIPLYPGLKRSDQDYIIESITNFYK